MKILPLPATIEHLTSDETARQLDAIVHQAVEVLAAGGLVIFPTETVYGAGVDATNPQAVAKLLAYKSRREGKPLSIAVINQAMAEEYVALNDSARRLYERFLPGPVTVVSQGLGKVAPGVESEFGTLGVRIPDYELVNKMVATLGRPITATSANASGQKRPYTIQDVFDHLSTKQKSLIDLVIDAGTLPPNEPSTVIDTTLSTPVTMRQGNVKISSDEEIGSIGLMNKRNGHVSESTPLSSRLQLDSTSEAETMDIAGKLLLKHWDTIKSRGLVIGLDGPLGAGKTIFTKGVARFLGITETITSPTYTYLEEYEYERHGVTGQLLHFDMWKVDSAGQLAFLGVEKLAQPGNVVVIEWWSQVVAWLPELTAAVISVTIADATQISGQGSPKNIDQIRHLTIQDYV